jgi:hypothetical protein
MSAKQTIIAEETCGTIQRTYHVADKFVVAPDSNLEYFHNSFQAKWITQPLFAYLAAISVVFRGGVVGTTHVKSSKWDIRQIIYEAFLPEGYPDSVSDDYLHYQVRNSPFEHLQYLLFIFPSSVKLFLPSKDIKRWKRCIIV